MAALQLSGKGAGSNRTCQACNARPSREKGRSMIAGFRSSREDFGCFWVPASRGRYCTLQMASADEVDNEQSGRAIRAMQLRTNYY